MTLEGEKLIAEINQTSLPHYTIAIWYLGQSSFVIKGDDTVIYVDPYLSDFLEIYAKGKPDEDKRRFLPPLKPEQVTNADLVFGSHLHYDHIDPDAVVGISRKSPQARFVVPNVAKPALIDLGVAMDRIVTVDVDEAMSLGNVAVTSIPSAHENLDYDPASGYPYRGYIATLNGVTFYHAGDCIPYDGLIERLVKKPIDIAMLPINGRDYFRLKRGFPGNFTYREAAEIAASMQADLLIPMHFGMHLANTEHLGYLVDYLADHFPRQKFHVMVPGERILYSKTQNTGILVSMGVSDAR